MYWCAVATDQNVTPWTHSRAASCWPSAPPRRSCLGSAPESPPRRADGNPFTLGVCAGDPDERSAVLWTRLTEPDGSALRRRLTSSSRGSSPRTSRSRRSSGRAMSSRQPTRRTACTSSSTCRARRSSASAPGTGRARSDGLRRRRPIRPSCASPRRAASTSRPGTTRPTPTSPRGHPTSSSSSVTSSTSTARQNLGGDVVRSHGSAETITIDEYRRRYALYLSDAQLQAARARVPVAGDLGRPRGREQLRRGRRPRTPRRRPSSTLDDSPPTRRGGSTCRCASRDPPAPTTRSSIAPSGGVSLADVLLLDGRQFRSDQTCGDVVLSVDPAVPRDARPDEDDARLGAGAVARRAAGDDDGDLAGDRPADGAHQRHAAQRSRAQLRPVGRLSGRPATPPAAGRPGAASRGAHWRHPPRRRRPAAGRRHRVRDGVDLLDRSRASRPRRSLRRVRRRRRRRARPSWLHPAHDHPGDVDGRVPHRRRRGHAGLTGVDVEDVRRRRGHPRLPSPRSERANIVGMAAELAIDRGPTDVALLDETIGDNLRRTIAAHGDNDALVARHQGIRWSYAEFGERVERLSAGLLGLGLEVGDRVGTVEPELRRVDAAAVRHRQHRRDPRQHQPGVPHPRAGLRPQPVGLPDARRRPVVQGLRLHGDGRPDRRTGPGVGAVGVLLGGRVGRARRRCRWRRAAAVARRAASLHARRPDQHPVHVGDDGVPQGRHALAPQHPQQRLLRHPPPRVQQRRPAVHPGALLPLLRHGHGEPRMHDPRGDDGHPQRRLRSGSRPRDGRRRAVHGAVRGADDVHRRARPPGLRALTT